ncbi:hypothetical protein LV779_02710 [Streptomyces thinghirensis]|nr:hypothetical protein [Streptomyces thinghirensis]
MLNAGAQMRAAPCPRHARRPSSRPRRSSHHRYTVPDEPWNALLSEGGEPD